MSASASTSLHNLGDSHGDGSVPVDIPLERIGEAATNFFCSEQFSRILGKEIDKRATVDQAESSTVQKSASTPQTSMQLSMGKGACKAAQKSGAEKKGREGERK